MKVLPINTTKPKQVIELGDVIVAEDGDAYLVSEYKNEIIARNFNGFSGLFGWYASLEEFTAEYYKRGLDGRTTVMSKGKYDLQLVPKKK